MEFTKDMIYGLNNMNVYSQRAQLGTLIAEILGGGGGGAGDASIITEDSYLKFPNIGNKNNLYIDSTQNIIYRWDSDNLRYYMIGSSIVNTINPSSADNNYNLGTIWMNSNTYKAYILLDNTLGNAVWKQLITIDDFNNLSAEEMKKSDFATNSKSSQGYVDKSISADSAIKLETSRTFKLTGDVNDSTIKFDGTKDVELNVILKNSGVVAGAYTKVTVDSKGRVVVGNNLAEADIPDLHLNKIIDVGTAASKNVGLSNGEIPILGTDGKLDTDVLPAIAITQVFEADDETNMLALDAQTGDVCVRSDINKSFILKNNNPTNVNNWVELKTPTDAVLSVNGKTGTVMLTTTNIPEGINLYYTDDRATANFNMNIANSNHTALKDGDKIMMTTDEYIIDGGNAD